MTAQMVLVPLASALAGGAGGPHRGRGGASGADRNTSVAAVVFRLAGRPAARVAVEVARTGRQLRRGLMYRTHLPVDAGMLFLFARAGIQSFWMRNTLIPLDMIFISSDMVVVGVVENAEPKTLVSRRLPGKQSQYVVEVNAGWARAHRVAAGIPVEFVGVAPLGPGEGEFDHDSEPDE